MPQTMSATTHPRFTLLPLAMAAGLCLAQVALAQDAGTSQGTGGAQGTGGSQGTTQGTTYGTQSTGASQEGAPSQSANPYYFGVSQAFTHDSNVFRRSENSTLPIVADTVSSTGILGGIDQPFGRQRFYANGTAATNRHRNQEQLNNTSYGLAAGLDWSALERLSGNLRLSANQNLANYGDANAATTIEKNLQKSRQASATVRYGVATALGIEAGVDHGAIDYSLPDDLRTVRQNSANIGLRWGGERALSFLLSGRTSQAKYPRVQTSLTTFDSDTVDRRDIDATVTYVPTGISTFTGTLRATHEKHSLAGRESFSGLTGGVSWDYRLSGRLAFNASLTRDTGTATTLQQVFVPSVPGLPIGSFQTQQLDANRLSTAVMVGANYVLTGKINLNGNLRRFNSSTNGFGSDTVTSYGLGVSYQPTRTVSLGCTANRESRKSVYSDNTVGCHGELTFR